MNILVIGSGGREHALCWKIAQSKKVKKIYCAPGNGGISNIAELVLIKADDIEGLLKFAKNRKIDLTIVGPETPLALGIVDLFKKEKLRIFGPSKSASRLEGSKIFAKEIMKKFNIPTAGFETFSDFEKACEYVKNKSKPLVIKADGLAQGKGVTVAHSTREAIEALKSSLVDAAFGKSGERVIVEDCLEGEEASIIVVSDGEHAVPMATSQDHKRIFDGDKGPNTGGMGAYSPTPVIDAYLESKIMNEVVYPVIRGMKKSGIIYKGILYAGIMVTKDGPKVLEFNVRFGDPETQAILPRLKSDIVDLMEASIDNGLKNFKVKWHEKSCVSVVMSSGGYPGEYEKGKLIEGIEEAEKIKDVTVFHAGTVRKSEKYYTDGGRVLGVTALGEDINLAIHSAYQAVSKIKFENARYRRDIGKKALLHSFI